MFLKHTYDIPNANLDACADIRKKLCHGAGNYDL